MNTCEMVLLADKNGKTYKSDELYYHKNKGFHDSDGFEWDYDAFKNFQENGRCGLNAFVHTADWEEIKKQRMTLKEIEDKLGYEVEIID
jgi:hypothetical protein